MTIAERIFEGLKTKFDGVEEAILRRMAEKRAEGVADEAKADELVQGIGFGDVVQSYGDYRAEEASKTAVRNYEKKFNLKAGQPAVAEAEAEAPQAQPAPPAAVAETAAEAAVTTHEVKQLIETELGKFQQAMEESNQPLVESIAELQKDNQALKDEKAQADFEARMLAAAQANHVAEDFLRFLKPDPDSTDEELDAFMKDFAQALRNDHLNPSLPPELAEQEEQAEEQALIDAIEQRTKELVSAATSV